MLEQEPIIPEGFEYLVDWAYTLCGRSGAGFGGLAPLSHREIEAWAQLMDIHELEPLEVEALLVLDAVLITKEEEPKPQEESPVSRPVRARWPKR